MRCLRKEGNSSLTVLARHWHLLKHVHSSAWHLGARLAVRGSKRGQVRDRERQLLRLPLSALRERRALPSGLCSSDSNFLRVLVIHLCSHRQVPYRAPALFPHGQASLQPNAC